MEKETARAANLTRQLLMFSRRQAARIETLDLNAMKGAGTLLATCVAGDLHEIGVRMVTDFFEMAGWNTYYLGASTPAQAVVDMVVQRRAQVLGISATILFHLHAVRELIQRVRAHAACRDVKILVGGYPFLASSELWRKLGADGCAPNAQEAITLAGRLIAEGGQA